jgi:hypothetical protein
LYHRAALLTLPFLLVVFADRGSDYNHLLDLVVLAVPVIGCLWSSLPGLTADLTGARVALTSAIVWVLFAGWTGAMERGLREVVFHRDELSRRYPVRPLVGILPKEGSVFSEDPWIDVARARRPVAQDPFALALLSSKYPEVTAPLVKRLEQGDFTRVVLLRRLDRATGDDWHEWYERHLGPAIVQAIADHYQLVAQAEGYFVYAPIRRGPGVSPPTNDHAALTLRAEAAP